MKKIIIIIVFLITVILTFFGVGFGMKISPKTQGFIFNDNQLYLAVPNSSLNKKKVIISFENKNYECLCYFKKTEQNLSFYEINSQLETTTVFAKTNVYLQKMPIIKYIFWKDKNE